MKSTRVRFPFAVAAVLLAVATAGYWGARRAKAQTTTGFAFPFEMVGLAPGETIRLNLVNISDLTSSPAACHAVLKFFDTDGHGVAQKEVRLEPGHATVLDLSWSSLKLSDRAEVRPHSVASSDDCVPSVEVFDETTRRTSFLVVHAELKRGVSGL